jgi:16S rRNA C1402 N4-methylase RsmH
VNPRLKPVGKLIKPNLTEVSNNPRSRSARLRVFEKIR